MISVAHRGVVLANSPLIPSHENIAGDQGALEGVRVVDVVEDIDGLLHVLERPVEVAPGDSVRVVVDEERRVRLARTHAAVVLTRAILNQRLLRVTAVEMAAGMAWVEVVGDTPTPDIDDFVTGDVVLRARNVGEDRLIVLIGGLSSPFTAPIGGGLVVSTWARPITARTGELVGTAVRRTDSDHGITTFEITLPDAKGRWWR